MKTMGKSEIRNALREHNEAVKNAARIAKIIAKEAKARGAVEETDVAKSLADSHLETMTLLKNIVSNITSRGPI